MKFQWFDHPAKALAAGYFFTIVAGMILLSLPVSTARGALAPIDALFTAASAVCVTGLTVVDTGSAFTLFGQIVILCLIELGGLGIMTFSTFFALLLFHRISFLERQFLLETMAGFRIRNFIPLLVVIFLSAISIQGLGALFLIPSFMEPGAPFGQAAYQAVFHSVSAFCNAGFSLFPDSLMRYQSNLTVNLIMMGLVIFGGLGFIVYVEIYRKLRSWVTRKRFRLSVHSKLVLTATVVLIGIGCSAFFAFERSNVLAGLPLPTALLASIFQAVTPRTAGFSTVNIAELTNAAAFFIIMLMFVGGAPGSAAGGVKVTTLSVFFLLIRGQLRGKTKPSVFGRDVAGSSIFKTITVLILAVLIISTAVILLQITETAGLPHDAGEAEFIELFFEAVSAFGTVGLSMGVTPSLTAGGKLILVFLMLIGKLGPLTLLLLMGFQERKTRGEFQYAEEEVAIG